ncbi:MAG: P-loop NTPase [Chloroflexi bacterium]|nr:P-loop NTPase [Chloroflexota bacterium]
MRITIASGKGGTGKTTVATALAVSLALDKRENQAVYFIDCDAEAPNAHLFLDPVFDRQRQAAICIPQVDEALCTGCGRCVEVCAFHALALIGKKIMVFPQLCHGCGSCTLNCPENAIREIPKTVGMLDSGRADAGIHFARGILTVSEPMPTPIIRQLKRWRPVPPTADQETVVILDAPPGASCSAVEALRGSDFALLVTEPTPFGLHDLKQIAGIVREMEIPAGVVINRDGIGNGSIEDFCIAEGLPILMHIPFDRTAAEGLSAGKTLVEIRPEYQERLIGLYNRIRHTLERRL